MAGAPDSRQWSWWAGFGEDPERFELNAPTRDAVIAQAQAEYGRREVFTIVEATQDGPFDTELFGDDDFADRIACDLIERFGEVNSGRFGEDGIIDFPRDEMLKALQVAFDQCLAEHGASIPTFTFTGQRNKEVVQPIADDAATVQ